ncbi:DUF294 nucleotidyltransferase-like domain-containing protein [Paraferrimonas sedimenticola]|uniref:Cyclic nucleotide-binding protein n=1 Tax=Paraferrimonas sedimenticola TaxID=375674 RepID=A0AA37W193_9GAMM|nr:DUF294 nucleotidyltransferase-like domain-containing protein [Paraferrimonas sedimenticola]GLP96673.1 cyclic nucleotide-binding protein [Paraferrimonas sedimenticola]
MDGVELQEVMAFFRETLPFSQLTESEQRLALRDLKIQYFAKAQGEVPMSQQDPKLYLVSSGAFEIRTPSGELVDRLSRGGVFGYPTLLTGEAVVNRAIVLEDGLLMSIDAECFNTLRQQNRKFDRFFNKAHAKRVRLQTRYSTKTDSSVSRVDSLMSRNLVSVGLNDTVQDCARLMRDRRVSSVLVEHMGELKGIVTDKDLRNRVLAVGLSADAPMSQVMTANPMSISEKSTLFEANLVMSDHHIHHLPVVRDGQAVGVLTSTDILRNQSSQPLFLINRVNRCVSVADVVEVSGQIPTLLQAMISADARAQEIGRVLTLVTDALTKRLIQLAEDQLGAPPMPYAWLAFGSQGRQDQMAKSDQDNGLLLAHEPSTEERAYFQHLANLVCDGLNECGFVHCPGDIMAKNPKWCRSLDGWRQVFFDWIDTPSPKALMHASIFFDIRAVYGAKSLVDELQNQILERTQGNSIFLAALSANALNAKPPLGFFKKFALERDGKEVKGIDLKHKGNALITDIMRIYALAEGVREVNTFERIRALTQSKLISNKDLLNLADAQEFIGHTRLSNQGQQFAKGLEVSNYLLPQTVSSFVRHQLRDAFQVVHRGQQGLALKFARGMA